MIAFFLFVSAGFKLFIIDVGAPYVTMDDQTMFSGGFLVWFGQAPPQRMYIESWFSGFSSIVVYAWTQLLAGNTEALNLNIFADAYSDFNQNPYPYVYGYRLLMLFFDLLTVLFIFKTSQIVFARKKHGEWLAAIVASLYLMSYNTIWCNIVARPDTGTALFAATSLFLYYRSNFGASIHQLWGSALLMGIATGYKLHGALFVIFILLDMWRTLGFRHAFKRCFQFGLISFIAFLISSGSAIFDPLLYAKLRALNVKDDASPWINWGDQIVVLFRGAGWFAIPLIFAAIFSTWKYRQLSENKYINSVVFLAICWIFLFLSIRQLRAYWMLPALPIIYMAAVSIFTVIERRSVLVGLSIIALAIAAFQSAQQVSTFNNVNYKQLSSWVERNIEPESSIYILGYEALNLPRNTVAINNLKKGIEKGMEQSLATENFTYRHLRLWEERSALKLFSMLEFKSAGYEYYGYHVAPLSHYDGIISFDEMDYVIFLDGFIFPEIDIINARLATDFDKVATNIVGPGGGGKGLSYRIYKRTSLNGH